MIREINPSENLKYEVAGSGNETYQFCVKQTWPKDTPSTGLPFSVALTAFVLSLLPRLVLLVLSLAFPRAVITGALQPHLELCQ